MVLVAGSPSFTDRALLEDTLLQTWHDAGEAFGKEHTLVLEHGCETTVDRLVHEWAGSILRLGADDFPVSSPMPADTSTHYGQAQELRDQQMIDRRPALCLAFVCRPDEVLPLEERAAKAGIPVQRCVREGE